MAALTLPGILAAFNAKALARVATCGIADAAARLFTGPGRHGELDLLDQHLADVGGELARIIPLSPETADAHALSLLAYILTVQLDGTLDAHYWAGQDIGRCLGALLAVEPKDRAVWVDSLPRDAMSRAFAAASSACGSEFGASATLNNRTFAHMIRALRRRMPNTVGLLFIAQEVPEGAAVGLMRGVPARLAPGAFLALPPATAALPAVAKALRPHGFVRLGEVADLLVVYQRRPIAVAKAGAKR